MSWFIRTFEDPLDYIDDVIDSLIPFGYHNDISSFGPYAARKRKADQHVVSLNVDYFKPEEIKVEVERGKIVVSGKHESSRENGTDKREFSRKYDIPQGYDEKTVKHRLTSRGELIVTVDKKKTIGSLEPQIKENEKSMTVSMDVFGFKPDELSVTVDGDYLVVHGQKTNQVGQGQDDQHKSTEKINFTKRIHLKDSVIKDKIEVHLDKEGMLTITAEKDPARLPQVQKLPITLS